MQVMSPLVGQDVRGFEGLHLYHWGLSNCSQKVRIVLAEKGMPWTSHPVDLGAGEQTSAAYRQINPNGTVPTLVHDGLIEIESSDIMEWLDVEVPTPPLRPRDAGELDRMYQWVARQDSIQRPLEIMSQEFFFPALGARRQRAKPSTIAGAVRRVDDALSEVNRHLHGREWLVGSAFSLADVAWVVDVHRFALMWFPMGHYPSLRGWYRRTRRRPSFVAGVTAFEPPDLRRRLALYGFRRWLGRSHAGAPRWWKPSLLADA
jgi:glutathione S-transferase